MGKCRIMLVFLLTCYAILCQNMPPAMLLKEFQKAVHAKCVFLVTYKKIDAKNPTGYFHTSALDTLRTFSYRKKPVPVAVLDWNNYLEEYFSTGCTHRSLNVLAVSDSDIRIFLLQLLENDRRLGITGGKNVSQGYSSAFKPNYVWLVLHNWLLFEDCIPGVYIPLNFQLYVVTRSLGNFYTIKEMYHLDYSAKELQMPYWGNWSPDSRPPLSYDKNKMSIFERRSNLKGTELQVITTDNYPFTLADDLDEDEENWYVKKNLVGHTWKILERTLNFRTVKNVVKKRTTAAVNRLLKQHSDKIALYDSSLYWKLDQPVEYLAPLLVSRFQVFLRHPGPGATSSWSTYMDPFSPSLWLTIGVFIVFVGFIEWGFALCLRRYEECHVVEVDLPGCLFMVYRAFCNQGQDNSPATLCQRIVCVSTYCCTMVVLAAYSANLIAALTNQRTILPFDDLEGLLQDRHFSLDVVEDSDAEWVLKRSSDPVMKQLYQTLGSRLKNRSESPSSMLAVLEEVCTQEKAVMIVREYALALSANLSCHIIALPGFSLPVSISLATSPGNEYAPFISHSINKIRRFGIIQLLLDHARSRQLSVPDVEDPYVSLANIKCIVVVFISGTASALLLLFLEIIYTKQLHKKEIGRRMKRKFRKKHMPPTK